MSLEHTEAIEARATGIQNELLRHGVQISDKQAFSLARSDRKELTQSLSGLQPGNADPAAYKRSIDGIQGRLDRIDRQAAKKERFLKKAAPFPLRHPILTAAGVGAAAYFGLPHLFRLFGNANGWFSGVSVNWLQRFRASLPSLGGGFAGGSVPNPAGAGTSGTPNTV